MSIGIWKRLAVATMLATMAIVGTGSAFAQGETSVFCGVNKELCPSESIVENVFASLAKPGMTISGFSGGKTINCAKGGDFHLLEEESEPGLWRFKPMGFEFSECTSTIYSSCKVQWEGQYSAELLPGLKGNGLISVFEHQIWKEGDPAIGIGCTFSKTPFTCLYSTPTFFLEFKGGEPASIHQSFLTKRLEGLAPLCPATVSLTADYALVNLWEEPGPGLYLTKS